VEKTIKEYLITMELLSYRQITLEILKQKYRDLTRRFHPDLTRRDTNNEMADINNANDYIYEHIDEANEELTQIWSRREIEFEKIFQNAILNNPSLSSMADLERSISLLKSIIDYKNSKKLIDEYQLILNAKIAEQRRTQEIYKASFINIQNASVVEIENAIKKLESIIDFKDARRLIGKYRARIEFLKKEEKRKETIYINAIKRQNDSISVEDIKSIVKDLNSISYYKDSKKIAEVYYQRINQFEKVHTRLAFEKNDIEYKNIIADLKKAKSIEQFQLIISRLGKIGDHKDAHYLIQNCLLAIEKIKEAEELKKKEHIYHQSISRLKTAKNIGDLSAAIDLMRKIRGFKDVDDLIENTLKHILDIEEADRKESIYTKYRRALKTNKISVLNEAIENLASIGDYKATNRLIELLKEKTTSITERIFKQAEALRKNEQSIVSQKKAIAIYRKLGSTKNAAGYVKQCENQIRFIQKSRLEKTNNRIEAYYQNGVLKDDEEVTIVLLKGKILTLNSIRHYKDSSQLISGYRQHLRLLRKQNRTAYWKKNKYIYFLSMVVVSLVLSVSGFGAYRQTIKNTVADFIEGGDFASAIELINSRNFDGEEEFLVIIEAAQKLDNNDYNGAIQDFSSVGGTTNIYYDYDGGNIDNSNPPILEPRRINDPQRDGYVAGSWSVDNYQFSLKQKYELQLSLKAIYTGVYVYTITYHLNGGLNNVSNPDIYAVNSPDITLNNPTKAGHTFDAWFLNESFSGGPISQISSGTTGNIDLYAKWEINKYTITWRNYNGSILEVDEEFYGGTPTYDGETPFRTPTPQYSYSFSEWSPSVAIVTEDQTYIALFVSTTNTYKITWKNYDGTILETDDNASYGSTPRYDGEIPTKTGDAQYSYTFFSWSPSLSNVIGDATYTAQYTSTIKNYTITWKNYDDTVLEIDTNVPYGSTPSYSGVTPTKSGNYDFSYLFSGWSPDIHAVIGSQTYFALFEQTVNHYYTVSWKNYDGTILEVDENVLEGSTPIYNGVVPSKSEDNQAKYTFYNWTPTISFVDEDITYVATFSLEYKKYEITWQVYIDWTQPYTILQKRAETYGTIPIYTGPTPTKPRVYYEPNFYRWKYKDFIFKGWSPSITPVAEEKTYTAVFDEIITYY